MYRRKETLHGDNVSRRMSFSELYKDISRDRDAKAARLQERRWHRLNQLGWQ